MNESKISAGTVFILLINLILCILIENYFELNWQTNFAITVGYLILNEARIVNARLKQQSEMNKFKGY